MQHRAHLLIGQAVVEQSAVEHDYPVRGREQVEHLCERRLRSLVERDDRL